MPYNKASDLPKNIKDVLPKHAQSIYMKAFNSAYSEYEDPKKRRGDEDRDEFAYKVAWNAVKNTYEKGADDKWHLKK